MMKKGRVSVANDISAELLKLGGEKVVQWMTHLAQIAWEKEKMPEDHKKGSFLDCDNFRHIALLSVPGKVFCKVIQNRVAERAEEMLSESQRGFHSGWGCVDQIFKLRVLAEKVGEFNTSPYLAFVDLRKAYDSVSR